MNANSKILIITSRADFGGGPEHIYKLTKQLIHDFDFYFAAPNDYPYYDKYCNLVTTKHIIEIPHRKFNLKTLLDLIQYVKIERIDIIHSHGKGAGIYSRMIRLFLKVKVIHTFHGIHVGNYNNLQKFFYLILERLLALVTDQFINVSLGENESVLKYKISSKNKFLVIENGVELPIGLVSESNFNQNPKIVLTFTRFDFAKNTELLIPILLRLKECNQIGNFRFLIFGSGPNKNHVKQLIEIKKLDDYVSLAGTTTETSRILHNSFCYISTSRWEGMPLGVLEAFAHGVPVIATNVVGNFNIIENNIDGILYNLNKPEEAAEELIRLSESKDLWLKFSKQARIKVENKFSVNRMALSTKQLYLEINNSLKH